MAKTNMDRILKRIKQKTKKKITDLRMNVKELKDITLAKLTLVF